MNLIQDKGLQKQLFFFCFVFLFHFEKPERHLNRCNEYCFTGVFYDIAVRGNSFGLLNNFRFNMG